MLGPSPITKDYSQVDEPSPVYRTTHVMGIDIVAVDRYCVSRLFQTVYHLNSLNRLLVLMNCVKCILLKLRTLRTLLHHLVLLLGVSDVLIPGLMVSDVQPNENVEINGRNVVLVDHRLMTSSSQPGVRKFRNIAF